MYRDFAADRSVGANEHSSTYRESAGTVLKSFHVPSATSEQEAELIMRRLVRNYLERSPIGSCRDIEVRALDDVTRKGFRSA